MYEKLTLKYIIDIAEPPTWILGFVPVLLGTVLSIALTGNFSPLLFYLLLIIEFLMHISVNTFNDYSDFLSGIDNKDTCPEPQVARMVHHNLNPRHLIYLGICYLVAAFLLGLFVIAKTGPLPFYIGIVGVLIIALYSAGPKPISYTPVGDLAAGFAMGGLIPFAVYYVLSGRIDLIVFYFSLPAIITIALMAFANNTCDIERDSEAGRKTLPIILGRKNAVMFYKAVVILNILLVAHIIFHYFYAGFFLLPLLLIHLSAPVIGLFRSDFTPPVRGYTLGNTLKLNLILNAYYMLMILVGTLLGC